MDRRSQDLPSVNKTDFSHPRDSYPQQVREFYAGINGADAAEPEREWQGDNWHCISQVSRGPLLEKAGLSMLHIVDGKIYGRPGSIKFFETLAYPADPRVPGFVFLTNWNRTEGAGDLIVQFTDIFFQDGRPNNDSAEVFAEALQGAYDEHGREFGNRFKTTTDRILAGIASEQGVMDLFKVEDAGPFLDDLLTAALRGYQAVLDQTRDGEPSDDDYAQRNRHRARLVEWLTVDAIGIQFAKESGVPLEVVEAYGYPPVVRY